MRGVSPRQEIIAALGEFVGTTLFLFLGLGGIKTAQESATASQLQTQSTVALANTTILFISTSMGLSLLITAWLFYRVTGGLFNPAVTLALWLVGAVSSFRAATLTAAQIVGGIAGSALIAALTPFGGIETAITTLNTGTNVAQGLFMEAFLTAALVFAVLMLAAEKHRATYLAPIGIGLTLFVCQLLGTLWTGCGMNPARAFGPSVVSGSFPGYHWIYWVGPLIGTLISVFIYTLLKAFDYGSVVLGQDSDDATQAPTPVYIRAWQASHGFTHRQRQAMRASGVSDSAIDAVERGMVENPPLENGVDDGAVNEKTVRPDMPQRNSAARAIAFAGSQPVGTTEVHVITMNAAGQNDGAMSPPGTHGGVMSTFGNALHHQEPTARTPSPNNMPPPVAPPAATDGTTA